MKILNYEIKAFPNGKQWRITIERDGQVILGFDTLRHITEEEIFTEIFEKALDRFSRRDNTDYTDDL